MVEFDQEINKKKEGATFGDEKYKLAELTPKEIKSLPPDERNKYFRLARCVTGDTNSFE